MVVPIRTRPHSFPLNIDEFVPHAQHVNLRIVCKSNRDGNTLRVEIDKEKEGERKRR